MFSKDSVNLVFRNYKIKAECTSVEHTQTTSRAKIKLGERCKIKDLTKYIPEIAFLLGQKYEPAIDHDYKNQEIIFTFISESRDKVFLDKIMKHDSQFHIGQTYVGENVSLFMPDCPHILIGGSTGSGKTVLMKSIIKNIQRLNADKKYTKDNIFIFDPKKNEFFNQKNSKVFSDIDSYITFLDSLIKAMDYRIRFSNEDCKFDYKTVPPYFLIIDELSDIVMSDPSGEFKRKLCFLAQKCRSADIFIIAATQRPAANLIDGNIKANFPVRITCRTASHIDSKIILDEVGAEKLMGRGDAIMKMNGQVTRFQVAI